MANIIFVALLLAIPGFSADLWPFGGGGSGNATKIRGVTVKASLGCTDGQVLTYVSANTQFECTDVSVAGGSGDITGVTAGTGLTGGGTSGGVTLALATVTASRALASDSSGYPAATSVTATELGYVSGVTSAIQTQLGTKATIGTIGTAGRNVYVSASGTITEDASFTRAAAGQYTLYDATGPGTLTVRGGSAQSTTAILSVLSNAASPVLTALNDGTVTGVYIGAGPTVARLWSTTRPGLSFASTRCAYWSNGTNDYDTADLALCRSSANNLGITNGSSTNYALIGSNGILPGADNTYDLGSSAASFRSAYIDTDVIAATTSFYYWGPTGSDGSWRMGLSGGNMVIQKRESGSWVTKSTVTP